MPVPKRNTKKAKKKAPAGSNSRVQKYRDKMRAAGLRPVQLWVPDTKDPAFIEQIRRECELIKNHADSKRVDEEMASVADYSGWE